MFDISKSTNIGTDVGIDNNITLGNSDIGLNINCVSFNLNIGTELPGNGQYLRYNTNTGSAKWQSLDNKTLNNQILNVFTGNCSRSSGSTFTDSTIIFPTLEESLLGISSTGSISGIGTHMFIKKYKKPMGLKSIILDYGCSMYDTNITTKLNTELYINGQLHNSGVFSKSLSGNQSKYINKQFIIESDSLPDSDSEYTFHIQFTDTSDQVGNVYLFRDNDTSGDKDVNITLTEIGRTNTLYGSSINGLPIGDTNPNTGNFTTLTTDSLTASTQNILSDDRLKIDEVGLTNCIRIVNKLMPEFYKKLKIEDFNQFKKESGFIAQDTYNNVRELRHLVNIADVALNNPTNFDNGNIIENVLDDKGNPSYLSFNYNGIIPYLVGAIKELNTSHINEITFLKTQINTLENKLSTLQAQANISQSDCDISQSHISILQSQVNMLLNI